MNQTKYAHLFDLRDSGDDFYFDNVTDYVRCVMADIEKIDFDERMKREIRFTALLTELGSEVCKVKLNPEILKERADALVKMPDLAIEEYEELWNFIRLPDFVTKADFDWAVTEATKKKKMDFSKVEFLTYSEGLCVQCMHIGSYDDEPATIAAMHKYAEQNGYEVDITDIRYHHEIYLSDPRKCEPAKLKTIVRHPIE